MMYQLRLTHEGFQMFYVSVKQAVVESVVHII